MGQIDALLKPLVIKGLTIRNRVMSTAHSPAYGEAGMPGERYQAYHEEKAKGGLGLTIFGGSSTVAIECPPTFGQLSVADDSVVPYLRRMAERIHRHGAATFCQISHSGRRTRWDRGHWLAPVAPSAIREPEHRPFPKEMEDWDFDRIRADFGQAARRVKDGGIDGVELLYAGGHLMLQFWSPSANTRADRYGGSLENRMRFGFECLEDVRAQVGRDFILGVRITSDELIADGLAPDECVEIARRLARSGYIDYLSVMTSQPRDWRSSSMSTVNMSFPVAPYLHLASAIKAAIDLPVFHAGRIPDPATAARAVAEGHLDMVAMTRAHIADPHFVRKMVEGREDDIRQCVGANYCIDRIYVGGDALCIQNPATGREQTMPHVVPKAVGRKTVVVAGAGVAGLEAARVSAMRGHRVVLFEADGVTGGQLNLAAKATWREGLSGINRWLDGQVRKLGVELHLGTQANAERVLAESPDVVVIATGGAPNKGAFEGRELAVSTWDVLGGRAQPAESILVFDDQGGHAGPSVAEFLAARGARVEVATPERYLGIEVGGTNFPVHFRELYKRDVVMTPNVRLVRVSREGNRLLAVLRNEYTLAEEERLVDQVVAEHGTLPRAELYFALKERSSNRGEIDLRGLAEGQARVLAKNPAGTFALFRVGDAVASRNIHAAIYDSLRLAKDF
ncbi:MAG: N-methylproline demethylase [Alphaproteobacteria bacterium]